MKLVSQSQMREMDRRTIEGGEPGRVLMERAGRGVLRSLLLRTGRFRSLPSPPGPRFAALSRDRPLLVLCGKGNNGGDGLVLARLLARTGRPCRVWMAVDPSELTGDAAEQVGPARAAGLILERPATREVAGLARLGPDDLVVDALLGTGLTGPARGTAAEWILRLSEGRARVVAVDLPSGLSGDTAEPEGPVVRADWTVTLALPKRSLPFGTARALAGPVDVVDIGIPRGVEDAVGADAELPEAEAIRSWLPGPGGREHKGRWGRLVVAGGSPGLTGAPRMAAEAALRTGAGLVRVAVPRSLAGGVDAGVVEAMTVALPEGEDGQILARAAEEITGRFRSWDALVLGPGLGRFPETERLVLRLLGAWPGPLLLDADALGALAEWGADSWVPRAREIRAAGLPGGLVLTPHVGEMERLTGRPKETWLGDPIRAAREWAGRWGATVVLKGAPSVVAAPDGRVWVNPTGNYGLATGGSGDVLSGIIGTFLAQGLDGPAAAVLGCYLHGLAADLWCGGARRALLPRDVIAMLPQALAWMEAGRPGPEWRWSRIL